jgi:hypothetical protein
MLYSKHGESLKSRMVTIANKRKDLSVEGKFKIAREAGNGGGGAIKLTYREFGLVNYSIQMIWKREPKLSVRLNRTGREECGFEILKEMLSMRHCLSGCSNAEVTMYV